eukprot:scaffold115225_cov51-Phaeocystis_antarctica.AAC.2
MEVSRLRGLEEALVQRVHLPRELSRGPRHDCRLRVGLCGGQGGRSGLNARCYETTPLHETCARVSRIASARGTPPRIAHGRPGRAMPPTAERC